MDAALENALTTWFQAEQDVRAAPWHGLLGDQRKAEHAQTLVRLQTSANALFDVAAQLSVAVLQPSKKRTRRA